MSSRAAVRTIAMNARLLAGVASDATQVRQVILQQTTFLTLFLLIGLGFINGMHIA